MVGAEGLHHHESPLRTVGLASNRLYHHLAADLSMRAPEQERVRPQCRPREGPALQVHGKSGTQRLNRHLLGRPERHHLHQHAGLILVGQR